MWDQSAWSLFERGGPVMWPILAASVIGVAVLLERTLLFLWLRESFDGFIRRIGPVLRQGDWSRAENLCQGSGPFSSIARAYLLHREDSENQRRDVVSRAGSLVLARMENRLRWLAVIGQLTPTMGLLGTVMGLVSAFHQIELLGGQVQPGNLANGIWEALLTTVFGLIVAIPAMASYLLFENRVDTVSRQMAILVSYLDEWRTNVDSTS